METEPMEARWRGFSEEVLMGMKQWRSQHPKATLREIEDEVSHQMSRLGAQMIQEMAQQSAATEWGKSSGAAAPQCPKCGTNLVARGKRKRHLQSSGGAEVELERSYGTCPTCGVGLFPPR